MLKSMTGFSRVEMERNGRKMFLEARSLNSRFLEVNIRIPKLDYMVEKELRDLVKGYVRRGRVEISLRSEKASPPAGLPRINEDVLRSYLEMARVLRETYGIEGTLRLEHLLSLKDILVYEEEEVLEDTWLFDGFRRLLEALDMERIKEGRVIERGLKERLERIDRLLKEIEERSHVSPREFGERLKEKIIRLVGTVDEARCLQEVCLFMERVDIAEEISRLKGHLANFRGTVEEPSCSGRKLDFIVQEMLREANTIAAKSQDLFINERVVEIKVEIEKMREEVQNVE